MKETRGRKKGTKLSEEHKAAISRAQSGKPKTKEHRKAMSEGQKRYWEDAFWRRKK